MTGYRCRQCRKLGQAVDGERTSITMAGAQLLWRRGLHIGRCNARGVACAAKLGESEAGAGPGRVNERRGDAQASRALTQERHGRQGRGEHCDRMQPRVFDRVRTRC